MCIFCDLSHTKANIGRCFRSEYLGCYKFSFPLQIFVFHRLKLPKSVYDRGINMADGISPESVITCKCLKY
jgi:hypothetical protein